MDKVKVNYVNEEIVYEAVRGTLLSTVNEESGFSQDLVCGGNGKCGKCATVIIENKKQKTVLSCQFEVNENIEVVKILNRANNKVNVLTSNRSMELNINPQLTSLSVTIEDIMPDHTGSFMDIITEKYKLKKIGYEALKKIARFGDIYHPERILNLIIFKDEIIDIQIDKKDIYGFAIDIGSTTVVGYLYEMESMQLKGTYSSLNKQTALGADVISRIRYATQHEDGLDTLQQKVFDTINQLISDAEADGYDSKNIYEVVLCGNSTMQHLFLGLYPESLGQAPFTSTTRDFVELNGNCTSLDMNPNGRIVFLPLLGGFVGADTTAVLLSIEDDDKLRVIIDLGTNGEIAVGTDENYVVCSTACGPALEGAGLTCGMRAAAGAIQHFKINQDRSLEFDVIENVPAIGICGSGIIDILAELLRNKVFNWRGKMLSREEYEELFGSDEISNRLIEIEKSGESGEIETERAFLLFSAKESANERDLVFTQSDLRYVQLAKAAIAAGTDLMIREYGVSKELYYEVCLAGAFGNYLDIQNAQYIGLLPEYGTPVRPIGNGAGTGVQLYLMDQDFVRKCLKIQKKAKHIELNNISDFKKVYAQKGYFKRIDY